MNIFVRNSNSDLFVSLFLKNFKVKMLVKEIYLKITSNLLENSLYSFIKT